MGFDYIRDYYGVPARRGEPVKYKGNHGVVTGTSGAYVKVRLEGQKHSNPYHPTDLEWVNLDDEI